MGILRKWEILIREAKTINPKVAAEIGCCPFPLDAPLAEGYGLSTLKFGEYLRDINCEWHSCDIDPEHIQNARDICTKANVPVTFYCQDGKDFLKAFKEPIDFLYLDNASEPEITLEQFKIAESKMAKRFVIVLDDCHTDSFGLYSKGTLTIPYAIEKGYDVCLVPAYGPSIQAIIKKKVHNEGN